MASGARLNETSLILGGARSGKSRLAEAIIERENKPAVYVATAQARDDEMAARIAAHQARRGAVWRTEEIPLDLAHGLSGLLKAEDPILVDCLTLWLSNILLADRDAEAEIEALVEAMTAAIEPARAPLVLVSNETGLGIVPENDLARRFRDLSGIMNQRIAAMADNVLLVAAGLPLALKGRNPTDLS
jgi:adenosylcobinamide kinase/adenosylcobinamide-phosphate guanylyltransferase